MSELPTHFPRGGQAFELRPLMRDRNDRLIYWREFGGESYGQLARRFEITRERVRVILQRERPDLAGKLSLGGRPPAA